MLKKDVIIKNNWTWEEIIDNCEDDCEFALVEFANGDRSVLLDNL